MTRRERVGWTAGALLAALLLLMITRSVGAIDFDFMPKGGRVLLLEQFGAAAQDAELRSLVRATRTEAEWREFLASRPLGEREKATLAAYLAVNMPVPESAAAGAAVKQALPRDGRDLAWDECQSCHSLFAGYLTQSRDAQGWRNVFLSPFHRQMAMTPVQREEFARYAALNMPLKVEQVPEDLRF